MDQVGRTRAEPPIGAPVRACRDGLHGAPGRVICDPLPHGRGCPPTHMRLYEGRTPSLASPVAARSSDQVSREI
jgi:hypothetical protein